MKQAQLFDQIPAHVWHIDWNVNCQAVSSSEACLKYLAPYVFKVAISNSRIIGLYDRTVLIRYRKPHSERSRTLALNVMEFIRRFLQHVLPTGFMKIRYYGFMNPNCAVKLDRIRALIELSYGFALELPVPEIKPPRRSTCPSCGGLLKFRSALPPSRSCAARVRNESVQAKSTLTVSARSKSRPIGAPITPDYLAPMLSLPVIWEKKLDLSC